MKRRIVGMDCRFGSGAGRVTLCVDKHDEIDVVHSSHIIRSRAKILLPHPTPDDSRDYGIAFSYKSGNIFIGFNWTRH